MEEKRGWIEERKNKRSERKRFIPAKRSLDVSSNRGKEREERERKPVESDLQLVTSISVHPSMEFRDYYTRLNLQPFYPFAFRGKSSRNIRVKHVEGDIDLRNISHVSAVDQSFIIRSIVG